MTNLSFAGCGFLGIYHVGVASCFRQYAPHVLFPKIAGASVGSVAAAALICDVSLGQTTTDILSVAVQARSSALGPLNPLFDLNKILKEKLDRALPPNAHEMCTGRLFISVTRWKDKKNVLLSEFSTRNELIQAILCSCFIPLYSGLACPYFRDEQYVDGGMSDNLPVLDNNTVTVSPFAGEHDICPQDETCNILQVNIANTSIAVSTGNLYRFIRVLFPPNPEILSKMCEQGFDDALKFLQRRNIISCTRCLGVRSVIKMCEGEMENSLAAELEHEFDNCKDCKKKRRIATFGVLPEVVVAAIQDACDQVNKGVMNWIFRNRAMRLLAFLGIPYTLPMDLSVAIFLKVWYNLPDFRQELVKKFYDIINLTKQLLNKLDSNRILYRAMFSCELSITEFNYSEDKVDSSYNHPIKSGNPCNIKNEQEKKPRRKFSIRQSSPPQLPNESKCRQQRKSYAGFPNNFQQPDVQPERRKSVSEINQPERVIRNMKFGFTVGVMPDLAQTDKNNDLFQSLKSLSEENSELNIMDLAKKAMGIEREFLQQHSGNLNANTDDSFTKAMSISNNSPLMSYCYIDEDKTIKINEIYNVTDNDTSLVMSNEEKQLNSQLQWESNWINPVEYQKDSNFSVVDAMEDHEFDTSDNECDLTGNYNEVFLDTKDIVRDNNNDIEFDISKPHRKTSFVIVN